jgi:hypothetical protein
LLKSSAAETMLPSAESILARVTSMTRVGLINCLRLLDYRGSCWWPRQLEIRAVCRGLTSIRGAYAAVFILFGASNASLVTMRVIDRDAAW